MIITFSEALKTALQRCHEFEAAKAAFNKSLIEAMEAVYRESYPTGPRLESFPRMVETLGMSTRVTNALYRNNIGHVLYLLTFSYDDVWNFRTIGQKLLGEIERKLHEYNLDLGMITGEAAERIRVLERCLYYGKMHYTRLYTPSELLNKLETPSKR